MRNRRVHHPAGAEVCPNLVLRQAQDEVLRNTQSKIALMVSLSNHEGVAANDGDR